MKAAILSRAWRTPLGTSVDDVFVRLLASERAVQPLASMESGTYQVRFGCPIEGPEPRPTRELRALRRIGLFGFEAAVEAAAMLTSFDNVGVYCGVGGLRAGWDEMLDAWQDQQPDGVGAWDLGFRKLHPFWMLHHLSNNTHALVAARLGATGDGATYGGANGGAAALVGAIRALETGTISRAIVFAYDSLLDPETLVELGVRDAAATTESTPPSPYSRAASGFVPGEAAAALVLCRADDAPDSCVTISAAVSADGQNGEPSASSFIHLARQFPTPELIDGPGFGRADALDCEELASFAPNAQLTCAQAAFGQLGAAASLVQIIAAECVLTQRQLFPISGCTEPNTANLRPVLKAEQKEISKILCLSGGAPGLTAAVITSRAPNS